MASLARVQLDLPFLRTETDRETPAPAAPGIHFVRVRSARRYILRVRPDGSLRVTLPRWGSKSEALRFVETERSWIARQRKKLQDQTPCEWRDGSRILWRGEPVAIAIVEEHGTAYAAYADRRVTLADEGPLDLRRVIEADLRVAAGAFLPARLATLAHQHQVSYERVIVRNQRSRWGSCSRNGTISLNFRLIQLPPDVCDYILIHELMHRRQQNHSRRFWRLVEQACPGFRDAERWLRKHGKTLF